MLLLQALRPALPGRFCVIWHKQAARFSANWYLHIASVLTREEMSVCGLGHEQTVISSRLRLVARILQPRAICHSLVILYIPEVSAAIIPSAMH